MTENEARQVLLLQAHESAEGPHKHWPPEDRAWATRQAVAAVGEAGEPERFVVARAGMGLQRLLPRDAVARRWLERRAWHPVWAWLGGLLGFIAGLVVDRLGPPEHVNLLAPAVWVVVAWNLLIYVNALLPWRRGVGSHLAPWLARWGHGGEGVSMLWARAAAPLSIKRAAIVLHIAAAALALGLMAGLYLRGLVLDYRAGWQSTFLEAPAVQAILNTLLAPASALTRIPVPDIAALRVGPGAPATASAAPWIHLYVATLALWVVLPRLLLAWWSAARANAMSRRFPLALDTPYFEAMHPLMRPDRSRTVRLLWVAPGDLPPTRLLGHAVAGLDTPLTLLRSEEGDELVLVPVAAAVVATAADTAAPWWAFWRDAERGVPASRDDAILLVTRPGVAHPEWLAARQRPVVVLHDAATAEPPVLSLHQLHEGWLPDGRLFTALAAALDGDSRVQRLRQAWALQQQARLDSLVGEIAASLSRVATARVPLGDDGLLARRSAADEAQQALNAALQDEWRSSAVRLAALHGRDVGTDARDALPPNAAVRKRVGEGSAAVVGGITTGAVAGLKADIATGGLTMGAGMVAGALIGALTAAGVARGVNVVRGTDRSFVAWDPPSLNTLTEAWLLRELPAGDTSVPALSEALAPQQAALNTVWKSRSARFDNADEAQRLALALKTPLSAALRDALARLHPVAAMPG